MLQFIALLLAMAMLAGLVIIAAGYRQLAKMQQHCDSSLECLVEAIAKEHLIVGHLLDALPSDFEMAYQVQLAEAFRKSDNALKKLRSDSSNRTSAKALADEQRQLLMTSTTLVKRIEDNDVLSHHGSIRGCIKGLADAQEKSHAAMVSYNLAVISMATHRELAIPSLVCMIVRAHATHRPLIDWTPDSSSSSVECDY
ncbi:secreted protein [Rhodopirellula maiorica SM1]|uniref:Secreted protein n=1 Tax=Rhodopirellula maiorica SM1 TaxID=1265738 RepID=M5RUU7_9BACT|nr:hypothetical protein [Rhodopirellula maiorica]EMI17724.1 secreted protein [Rhodopirellula maiorica SM1]